MSLESIGSLMEAALRGGYAIGYFESWNIESLQGVIDAAEGASAPVIIGFNGQFLCGADRFAAERLSWYGALGAAAARSARVPCGFIFNECSNDSWARDAVLAGFNLVMLADPEAPDADYERRVAALVAYAHAHGVAVEAQVGTLPSGASGGDERRGAMTDPESAARFVSATGADLLAVSVGNAEMNLDGQQGLDLGRLAQVHSRVAVPLVLHGGSGIASDSLRGAIGLGVAKVNFGTYLKQRYLAAVREALGVNVANPHELLGMGGDRDAMVAGRLSVRDAVFERIEALGCCGQV